MVLYSLIQIHGHGLLNVSSDVVTVQWNITIHFVRITRMI